jgi:hypothetical protein
MPIEILEVNNPTLDFKMNNLEINFVGVSVSDPKTDSVTGDPIFYGSDVTPNAPLHDKLYILNKNTKSVFFNDVKLKDAVLRNRYLSSNEKNLITSSVQATKVNEDVNIKHTFQYNGRTIGVLDIRFPYSYYIKENVLILPFQSFPIQAFYTVVDPGVLPKHYFGKSVNEPDRRTGTLDMNFIVSCATKEGTEINEDVTISVNLINGGFVRNSGGIVITPGGGGDDPDDGPDIVCPPVGTLLGYVCTNGCYKTPKYANGNCGYTLGAGVYDEAYCGCTPSTTNWEIAVENFNSSIDMLTINGSQYNYIMIDGSFPVNWSNSPTHIGPPNFVNSTVGVQITFGGGSPTLTVTGPGGYNQSQQVTQSGWYYFNNVPAQGVIIHLSQ